jgi:hypothetical protein
MTRNKTDPAGTTKAPTDLGSQTKQADSGHDVPIGSESNDLVDVGSEYSFPASDPPSYMGGTAITGAHPTMAKRRARESVRPSSTRMRLSPPEAHHLIDRSCQCPLKP